MILFWMAIAATIVMFWQRSSVAGILFLPYLAWVGFASVLNLTIWRMKIYLCSHVRRKGYCDAMSLRTVSASFLPKSCTPACCLASFNRSSLSNAS